MILYSNDKNGNIIEGKPESIAYGEPVYNPRVWSETLPDDPGPGKIYIMDGVNPGWQLVDDTRGIWYRTDTGEKIIIDRVGVLSEGLTKLKPADDFQKWDGSKWVLDIEKKAYFDELEAKRKEEAIIQAEIGNIARERLGLQRQA